MSKTDYYLIENFQDRGVFEVSSTYFNKVQEKCVKGYFKGDKREYDFILNEKDTKF